MDYFKYEGTISDEIMCALGEARRDAYQGDSGGLLIRLGHDPGGGEGEIFTTASFFHPSPCLYFRWLCGLSDTVHIAQCL